MSTSLGRARVGVPTGRPKGDEGDDVDGIAAMSAGVCLGYKRTGGSSTSRFGVGGVKSWREADLSRNRKRWAAGVTLGAGRRNWRAQWLISGRKERGSVLSPSWMRQALMRLFCPLLPGGFTVSAAFPSRSPCPLSIVGKGCWPHRSACHDWRRSLVVVHPLEPTIQALLQGR